MKRIPAYSLTYLLPLSLLCVLQPVPPGLLLVGWQDIPTELSALTKTSRA